LAAVLVVVSQTAVVAVVAQVATALLLLLNLLAEGRVMKSYLR
jgi:hypothetical protein